MNSHRPVVRPRRPPQGFWARARRWRPRLTLGHFLIATAIAAVPLAAILPAARRVETVSGKALVALIVTAAVVEVELAFWLFFGPAIQRRLVPPRPEPPDAIRWLDEPPPGDPAATDPAPHPP